MKTAPWLMAALLLGAGCANSESDAAARANPTPLFETDIAPIFGKSCGSDSAGCHRREAYNVNENQECRGWLSLENVPLGSVFYAGANPGAPTGCPDRDLYDRLFMNAWMCGSPTDPKEEHVAYVVPCNPEASLLYRVMGAGPLCSRMENYMPMGQKADPVEVQTIYNWIANGAPRLNDPGTNCGTDAPGATPPAPPSELTVEPMGDGLHVTWRDDSDNEDNFVVERHDGSGVFIEIVTLPFDSTSHHDAPLTSGATYTYRILARNTAGTGSSAEVTAQAP